MATGMSHLIEIIFASRNAALVRKEIEQTWASIGKGSKTLPEVTAKMGQFESALRRAAIVAPTWMVLRGAIQAVTTLVSSQVKFIIDLETAMARIKIVGKGTAEEFKNLEGSIITLAYAYGVSASEAVAASVIFAQQGKTVQETLRLTQQAMLAATILGTDMKTTVNDLTAALQGFNIPMERSIGVIDKWIAVEKEFAVTSADLANATKVAGASANQLGVTLSQFLGNVTGIIEVTRQSGESAARALSFIYARLLTTAKPVVESLTGIKFYMDENGKSTSNLSGKLRSISSILGELAGKWNTLSTAERLQIATSLGSKRQMTALNALMQNYARVLDAEVVALSSAGQAQKAFNIIQDTAAYKIKQVESAWNALTVSFANTTSYKTILDVQKNFLTNLTYMIDKAAGFKLASAEIFASKQRDLDDQISAISNLKELINLRNTLAQQPVTTENKSRLDIVDKSIDAISKLNPTIDLKADTAILDSQISDIERTTISKKVELEVVQKNIGSIAKLEAEINALTEERNKLFRPGTEGFSNASNKIISKEKEIENIQTAQTAEIEKQTALTLGEYEVKKGLVEVQKEEEEELVAKKREQLEIDARLSIYSAQIGDDKELILQKEIELIQASEAIYTNAEKLAKTEELHNKLLDVKLQKRRQEKNEMNSLLFQYDKADMFEKSRIKRAVELQSLSAEQVASAYQSSNFDKKVIQENLSTFDQTTQDRLAQSIATSMGIGFSPLIAKLDASIASDAAKITAQTSPIVNNTITNKGAEAIYIELHTPGTNVPEIVDLVKKDIGQFLMADETFLRAMGKKI